VTTTGPMAVPGTQSNTPLETGSNIGGAIADTSATSTNYDQSGYEQGTHSSHNNRQGLAGRECRNCSPVPLHQLSVSWPRILLHLAALVMLDAPPLCHMTCVILKKLVCLYNVCNLGSLYCNVLYCLHCRRPGCLGPGRQAPGQGQ
jgi:hypothetical protein